MRDRVSVPGALVVERLGRVIPLDIDAAAALILYHIVEKDLLGVRIHLAHIQRILAVHIEGMLGDRLAAVLRAVGEGVRAVPGVRHRYGEARLRLARHAVLRIGLQSGQAGIAAEIGGIAHHSFPGALRQVGQCRGRGIALGIQRCVAGQLLHRQNTIIDPDGLDLGGEAAVLHHVHRRTEEHLGRGAVPSGHVGGLGVGLAGDADLRTVLIPAGLAAGLEG